MSLARVCASHCSRAVLRVGLLAVLACACSATAMALDPDRLPTQYRVDALDRHDGLPGGVVWSMVQDELGYLWLGTQNGLVRFDGVRFQVHNRSSHPGLLNDDVRVVHLAGDGSLWLGTYGGGVFRLQDGDFSPFGQDQGLPHGVVYDITEDRHGNIWFATAAGAARLAPDGTLSRLTAADGLAHDRVFRIVEDSRGTLWFATLIGGLSMLRDGQLTTYTTADGLVSNQVHDVFEDRHGQVWVGTYAGGFHRMTDHGPEVVNLPEGMAGNGIQRLLEDRDGNLWLGTYANGLIRWHDGQAAHLAHGPLAGAFVFDLLEDVEGNLWLATRAGLIRIQDGKLLSLGAPEGLADASFVVTGDPSTGVVWVGTEGRGLFRIDGAQIERFTSEDGLASDNISALARDHDGGLWVGSFGAGLNHFTADGIRVYGQDDGLSSNHLFALLIDDAGQLWVAADGGLSVLREGGFETYTTEDGLPDALIRQIFQDRGGDLWLGTNGGGLSRFDGQRFHNYGVEDGLAGNLIFAFHEDVDGQLWIGTRGSGLSLYRDGRFFSFGPQQGLPQAGVYAIAADDQGFLWMTGSAGLVRASRVDLLRLIDGEDFDPDIRLFDESDGLRGVQFAGGFQPASWQGPDGRLWFPGQAGLVVVDPAQLRFNMRSPPVVIEAVLIDGDLHPARALSLPPGPANLEIRYTALSLTAPQKNQFRYRLEGFDRDWQRVSGRRSAYYTGLPPGQYRFVVQAANNDGVWNTRGAELQIVQAAHFYQMLWFWALCAGLLLLAGIVVLRLLLRRYRQREQRLAELVSERTVQLERALESVERASRIDGLTAVANRGYFEERLTRAWRQSRDSQEPIGLIMVDIDHFKRLNDSQGHQVGDDCLRQVATALTESARRPTDLVARYGGEEFIVLLPGAGIDDVVAMAERMRARIEFLALPHPDGGIDDRVTISAGCAAVRPGPGQTARSLLEKADAALYEAKRSGRNRVVRAISRAIS
ncbi:MAG: diguanylate cyclase [Wenzhouxiangella sp.]|nr:MAG: diguanylate cyclase [Wenzhouxiangella sp.]